MAPEKNRKSRKVLTARQIVIRDEKRQKIKNWKEKEENKQADLLNNPPVIEITPEPQIPVTMLAMPDISFINQPDQRQNVVRAFVVIKQKDHLKRTAVSGQKPAPDPFNRQSFRPRLMGFKLVIPVEAAPVETVEMATSSDSQGTQAGIRRLDVIPVEAAPAETVEMTASSGSHRIQAEIVESDDIPEEVSPAKRVKMTASSDSHGTQAEIVELDDTLVEAPPAKRFKMTTSLDSRGIQAEIVGLSDIQGETAAPAETVEMTASSDSYGIQAVVEQLDDIEGETSNGAPRDLIEMEPQNDIIPDDSDLNSFLDEFALSLDPDAPVSGNLYDLLSTCDGGLKIDESWLQYDTIELMDVS